MAWSAHCGGPPLCIGTEYSSARLLPQSGALVVTVLLGPLHGSLYRIDSVQPLAVYAQAQGMDESFVSPLDVDQKDLVEVEPSSKGISEESDGLWDS